MVSFLSPLPKSSHAAPRTVAKLMCALGCYAQYFRCGMTCFSADLAVVKPQPGLLWPFWVLAGSRAIGVCGYLSVRLISLSVSRVSMTAARAFANTRSGDGRRELASVT